MKNSFNLVETGVFAVLAVVIAASSSSAQLIPVTSCGQVVNGDAELPADLDCSAEAEGPMLTLTGRLYLNGHTIKGNPTLGYSDGTVVKCAGGCTLIGPGTIRDGYSGVYANTDLTMNDVTLEGTRRSAYAGVKLRATGIHVVGAGLLADDFGLSGSFVDIRDSVITNSGQGLVCDVTYHGKGTCSVRNTVVSNNAGFGIDSVRGLKAREVTVTGNGWGGIRATWGKLSLRDSLVQDNGFPVTTLWQSSGVIALHSANIRDSEILDNASAGVLAGGTYPPGLALGVSGSTFTGNGDAGVVSFAAKSRFKESTLTGNCLAPTEAPTEDYQCADLSTNFAPHLVDTTCDTSNEPYSGTTWGVCALD